VRCRGSLLPDLAGGLAGLGVLGLIMIGAAAEGRSQARSDGSAVALEHAQNLLAQERHGLHPPLPWGWQLLRTPVGPGLVEVRVRGPGFDLATLVTPAPLASKP
jgi:hypothetical protein